MIKISDFQLKTIIGETIKEELGSFENQNQIAKYLASEAELAYKELTKTGKLLSYNKLEPKKLKVHDKRTD